MQCRTRWMCPLRSWYIQWVCEGLHGWEEDMECNKQLATPFTHRLFAIRPVREVTEGGMLTDGCSLDILAHVPSAMIFLLRERPGGAEILTPA